jgi:alpha-tubulin suppressor-like RCC1 family protein
MSRSRRFFLGCAHSGAVSTGAWLGAPASRAALAVAMAMALAAGPAATAASAASRPATAATAPITAVAWGDNSAGELGDGTLAGSDVPEAVSSLTGVTAVAAGGRHDVALLSGGTVEAWGDDTFGQLGDGIASANGDSEAPVQVPGLSSVTAVAAGEEHSLALQSNGTVLAWGDNQQGQLGDGGTTNSSMPVLVSGLTGVKAIAAGSLFSLALLKNGTVMAWGDNEEGQLGNGTQPDSDVPVPVTGLSGVTAIAGGGQFALALLSNGTAMSWGDNESDQLGDGQDVSVQSSSTTPVAVSGLTGAVALAAGSQFALARLSSGTVVGWGDNEFNELAQPNDFPGGISDSDVPVAISGLSGVTAITAGGLFALAVSGGQVIAWGDNAFGQLGNASEASGPTLVTVSGLSGATAVAAGTESAVALLPGTAGPSAVAGKPVSSPWRVTPEPVSPLDSIGLDDTLLSSVSGASASDVWAVGASPSEFEPMPLAEHWDGSAWSNVPVPLPATDSSAALHGVLEESPGNVWTVGDATPVSGGTFVTLIEHWNGSAWSVVPSPDPETGTGTSDTLQAIGGSSPSDLWAVGSFNNGSSNNLLFEHWNGTAWSFVAPPVVGGEMFAESVTAISPSDAWVVGDTEGGTISAHWNGTAWSLVATPTLEDGSSPSNFLTGVTAISSDNVWASGYEGNVDDENLADPYVLHWNGTAWSLTRLPNSGTEGSQARGITALSASDVWVGGETLESDGGLLSLTEQYNGSSWSLVPSLDPGENPPLVNNTFSAVATVAPGTLFAVGTQELPTQCCLQPLAESTTAG